MKRNKSNPSPRVNSSRMLRSLPLAGSIARKLSSGMEKTGQFLIRLSKQIQIVESPTTIPPCDSKPVAVHDSTVTNVSYFPPPALVKWSDMKAWPFMFSRTFSEDYGTVALPDFIQQAGAGRELGNACDNVEDIKSEAIHLKCFHPKVGEFDAVYRVVDATERMLGKDSDTILCDVGGRNIRIMEGLAFEGRLSPGQLQFTKSQLDAAHHAVEDDFRRFWKADRDRPRVAATSGIKLPSPVGESLPMKVVETPATKAHIASSVSHPSAAKMVSSPPPPIAELPKRPLPESPNLPTKGGFNTTAMFLVVTGVAVGAFLAYRHFIKSKAKPDSYAQRAEQERASAALQNSR